MFKEDVFMVDDTKTDGKPRDPRKGHVRIPNDFIKLQMREVGGSGMLAYLALVVHLRGNAGNCYPSLRRLSELTGLSRSGVKNAIKHLEELGIVQKSVDPGGYRPNTFNVDLGRTKINPPPRTKSSCPRTKSNRPPDKIYPEPRTKSNPEPYPGEQDPLNKTHETPPKAGGGKDVDGVYSEKEEIELEPEIGHLTSEYLRVSTKLNNAGRPAETKAKIRPEMRGLRKAGISKAAILAEIHRNDRNTAEWVSAMVGRLMCQRKEKDRDHLEFEYKGG